MGLIVCLLQRFSFFLWPRAFSRFGFCFFFGMSKVLDKMHAARPIRFWDCTTSPMIVMLLRFKFKLIELGPPWSIGAWSVFLAICSNHSTGKRLIGNDRVIFRKVLISSPDHFGIAVRTMELRPISLEFLEPLFQFFDFL